MNTTALLQRDSGTAVWWQSDHRIALSTVAESEYPAVSEWLVSHEAGQGEAKLDTASIVQTEPGTTLNRLPAMPVLAARPPQTLLAEWSGHVLSVEDFCFTASLKGIFGEGIRGEEEDAEIPISDVGEADKDLLQPGSFFRLCVFYEIQDNERPRRYTQVIFRRLPAYRADELAIAAERGLELHRGLRVE